MQRAIEMDERGCENPYKSELSDSMKDLTSAWDDLVGLFEDWSCRGSCRELLAPCRLCAYEDDLVSHFHQMNLN